jgi:hypothetical protein
MFPILKTRSVALAPFVKVVTRFALTTLEIKLEQKHLTILDHATAEAPPAEGSWASAAIANKDLATGVEPRIFAAHPRWVASTEAKVLYVPTLLIRQRPCIK